MAATLIRVVLACPKPHEAPRGRPSPKRINVSTSTYVVVKLSLLPRALLSGNLSSLAASHPLLCASRASHLLFSSSQSRALTHVRGRYVCARSHGSWNDYRCSPRLLSSAASSTTRPVSRLNRPVIRGNQCLSTSSPTWPDDIARMVRKLQF